MKTNTYKYYIGIDTGVNTGIAVYDSLSKALILIKTTDIISAIDIVKQYHNDYPNDVFVRVEDARKRKWYGAKANAKQQGAGSVKRDAKMWEDFLKNGKIPHEMTHPIKGATKLNKVQFEKITGYKGTTSEHSRDAAMLVFGLSRIK